MKLLTLDDIRPTPEEIELTREMPEQVAVGFIRARRKDQQTKRKALNNRTNRGSNCDGKMCADGCPVHG